jgi:hypothetical protein
VASVRLHLPSSAQAWDQALTQTLADHRPAAQRALIEDGPAGKAAAWLEQLAAVLWSGRSSHHPSRRSEPEDA